jgi:hypothetical protein
MQPSGCIRLNVLQLAYALSDRGRCLEAAFRSSATKTCFQAPIARSTFLAYFFDIPSNLHRIRSGPTLQSAPPASAPLRGFDAPLAHSVQPVQPSGSPPSQVARFPFTPRGQTPLKMMTAADQRSEFASSREVRCFHEPLGKFQEAHFRNGTRHRLARSEILQPG